MHEVNRLGGLSLPRESVVRLTDRPDMTLDVYRGRETTIQQHQNILPLISLSYFNIILIVSKENSNTGSYTNIRDPKRTTATQC